MEKKLTNQITEAKIKRYFGISEKAYEIAQK